MGDKKWFQVCSPQVQSYISLHPDPGLFKQIRPETPHCEDWKRTSTSGGVNEVPWAVVGLAPLITKQMWHWWKWVDKLAKASLGQDIDPLTSVHYTDMKPLVSYYIQKLVQIKWDVAVHSRDLYRETNAGATEGIPAPNQSWRGCNHPTSNWPYKGHQTSYLVPRTADFLSPLWSNTDHWPYAPGVCSFTGMSWWTLHSRLIECPLRDNSWDLHSGIPERIGILL